MSDSNTEDIPIGHRGRVRGEKYQGLYVTIEEDRSRTGWHIFLHHSDPRIGRPDLWDIWADSTSHVFEWIGPSQLDVEWID